MTTRGNNPSLTREEIDTMIKEAVDSVVGRMGKTMADAIKKEINKKISAQKNKPQSSIPKSVKQNNGCQNKSRQCRA